MKILFFPSDTGNGFGHISMSLALAGEAKVRGHTCAFVLYEKKFISRIKNNFKVFSSFRGSKVTRYFSKLRTLSPSFRKTEPPFFTEFSKIDYMVLRDGLINEKIIMDKLERYLEILRHFKPDVLVGDTDLLVWIVSQKTSIPAVQITRYLSNPVSSNLIWWKNPPKTLCPPDSLKLFNSFLIKNGLPRIDRTEELFAGDFYIVPSTPQIEPIAVDSRTEFVGSLINSRVENIRSWIEEPVNGKPLIYLTIGGGAGGVGTIKFFSTFIEAFEKMPVQVVISVSKEFKLTDLPRVPKNIRFFQWVPGRLVIENADLIIFHGGFATMMEILSCGKPSIVIPFHSEQEGNGRRLEQLGCGRVIKLSRQEYIPVECEWEFGKYNYLIQNRFDLTAEELIKEVNEVLNNDEYRKNAENLKEKIKNYGGAAKAVDLIEEKFQKN